MRYHAACCCCWHDPHVRHTAIIYACVLEYKGRDLSTGADRDIFGLLTSCSSAGPCITLPLLPTTSLKRRVGWGWQVVISNILPLRAHHRRGSRGLTRMNSRRSLSSVPTESLVNSAWPKRDTGQSSNKTELY